MKCAFCGFEFSEEEGIDACRGCPVSGCKLIKCPNCGYETPPEPQLLKRIKRWFKHGDQ